MSDVFKIGKQQRDPAEGGDEEAYIVDGAKLLRMRSRRGGFGKKEGRSVLENRDEESWEGPF